MEETFTRDMNSVEPCTFYTTEQHINKHGGDKQQNINKHGCIH